METPSPSPSAAFSVPLPGRESLRNVVAFWEWRRLGYNGALTLVTLAWLVLTWPHFRPAMSWRSGLLMLALAGAANLCYCAAYPVDLALQLSPFRSAWLKRRWMLWAFGVVLGVMLACYWIGDEIYPYVG